MREAGRKQHRQRALLRLVRERHLATQSDLVRALRSAGITATQATVSRDVEELGLLKVTREGGHGYAAPDVPGNTDGPSRLRRLCEDYPVEGALAGNLVVIRSLPGTANALAAALDAADFPEAIGTIAGDDTVFVAAAEGRAASALLGKLSGFGVVSHGTAGRS
ncbi:MAG: arginine repressor [Chloroflexi bacterium]|nr:arginine repressor [Chloroflexota bacterium]